MSDFARRNMVKAPVQAIGQMQSKYLFQVFIPYIPMLGPGLELTFLVRSTSIPEIKREATVIKTVLKTEYTVPNRPEHPHEWPMTLILPEIDNTFRQLYLWNLLLDKFSLNLIKTTAIIVLMDQRKIPTKEVTLTGVYPKGFPSLSDLNYDSVNDFVMADFLFAYDTIDMV